MNKLTLMCVLIFAHTFTFSQIKTWTGFSLGKDLSKKYTIDFKSQIRDNDGYRYSNGFSHIHQLGIERKLNKRFDAGLGFRTRFNDQGYHSYRIQSDFTYSSKKKKRTFRYSARLRFQHRKKSDETFQKGNTHIRLKPVVNINASKLVDPLFGIESFFRLNGKYNFDEFRWYLGANWRIKKNIKLKSCLISQRELGNNTSPKEYVFLLGLKIGL